MPLRERRIRPWVTLLLSALVALGPAAPVAAAGSASAPAPASAAPDRGWNNWSCKPSAAHPRPVVLVHGTFANSVDNWLGLAPYLVNRGYCVYSLDYGQLPGVPFFHGLGPVARSAGQLDAFVDRVLAATGAPKADLVGHSQGGMMPRHYLKFLGGAAEVNALIGIAPSNRGTDLLGLTRLLRYFPGAEEAIGTTAPALTDQIAGSPFLTRLNAGGDTVPGVRYTVIATRYDQVVTPYRSQFLTGPGVRNVLLQDLCPLDFSEHVAVGTIDRIVFHEVAGALDPPNARKTDCASVIG
ncbi:MULTISPECIES: esterase/lipase family protein [Streptomyces]|uniref:Lipase n=1 Tax=Streptomyces tsukubensis (strain DSM 42081 / NBRC 108919 / NRRL 18488 / 9993) TaxID=1114943 RepID=I2MVX3_STRT9|nr:MULTISPECIES: alpha/beta fold hydrolase [Streptomyces]AZK93366.1 lipase [Streptomyces tsukubensis]EIF88920.1 lipase [Streptomyces tsukubensis NRRL18488]MYS64086.1 alpha/beta fold hydrolase [Streptomyces sp. SID5473]QKM70477.1 lipase [Streptomyces tsukubensis NRRL18488]TAI40490.1 alpha/beta fold hydrolase [Streptomyces tsukubensis]